MWVKFTYFDYNDSNPYISKTGNDLMRMIRKYSLEQVCSTWFKVVGEWKYMTASRQKMSSYKKNQVALREFAKEWQNNFSQSDLDLCYSWQDIFDWSCFFEEYGKKYGLLREFKENGLC